MVVTDSFSCVVQDYVFVHCSYKCYCIVRFPSRSEVCVCVCVCLHSPYLHLFFFCTLVPAQRIDVFYYYLPLSCLLCVYCCTFCCVVWLNGLAGHVVFSVLCGTYDHRAAYINQVIEETSQYNMICNYSAHTLNDKPQHAWIQAITFAGDWKWRKHKRRKAFVIDTTTMIKAVALYKQVRQQKSRKCKIFRIKPQTYKIEIINTQLLFQQNALVFYY
jgi:hypothetical protein